MRKATATACALVVLFVLFVLPGGAAARPHGDTHLQLLAINDFHGHLAPDTPGTIQTGCWIEKVG